MEENSISGKILGSGLFDADWYLKTYGYSEGIDENPLDHFQSIGIYKGLNPSERFDSDFYLKEYPDVAKSKIPPFLHYLLHGIAERRVPCRFSFGNEFNVICRSYDEEYGVECTIHPEDFMYQHYLRAYKDIQESVKIYHANGFQSATQLKNILFGYLEIPEKETLTMLEFAAGYGRLTRHLSKLMPLIDVTASDIHSEANSFNQRFGVRTVESTYIPEEFSPKSSFDIIFVFSLFTHLPRSTWERWLISLYDCLNPGGHLIFTTHGTAVAKLWGSPVIDADGYLWSPQTEQYDIDLKHYGGAISLPTFVIPKVMALHQSEVKLCAEARFQRLHDLYVVKKLVSP